MSEGGCGGQSQISGAGVTDVGWRPEELQMLVVGTSYVGAGNELNSGSLDEQAVCALKG